VLPVLFVEETTVRESGHSAAFDTSEHANNNLLLTFGITHAVERESIRMEIQGSKDGVTWRAEPILSFGPKYYCGTYELILPRCDMRYIRAVWKVSRWSRADRQPFFRFYLLGEPTRVRVRAASAA
jgi:hypothetical protein